MNVSFAGCGFLAFYHLGVATCLSSHAPQFLKNVTAFAGASAGSLVATMLATSAPLNKCTDFVIDLTDEARGHPLGPFNPQFDLVGSLRKCLQLYLPSNSHKIASGRLYISVTSLKDRKNAIISEFESTEELIQVLLASCYIPFYSGFKFPQFKGQKWVDGGLSDNLPRLPFGRTIRISPFSGKHYDICPQDASHGFTDSWYDGGFSDNMPAPPSGSTIRVCPFSGDHEICPRDKSRASRLMRWGNWNVHVSRENLLRSVNIMHPPGKRLRNKLYENGFSDAMKFIKDNQLN